MQNVHPYIVHFPIALLVAGLLFDLLGMARGHQGLRQAGWWTLGLGMLGLVAAVTSGLLAERTVAHTDSAHAIIEQHERMGYIALGIFAVIYAWRSWRRDASAARGVERAAYAIVALGGTAVLLYGSSLGGRLVYEHGVGTALTAATTTSGDAFTDSGHDHDHDHDAAAEVEAESESEAPSSAAAESETDPRASSEDPSTTAQDEPGEGEPAISPYADQMESEIRGLSASEIRGLAEGEGMGLARAAELNRYPGPRHVIELEEELALTLEQHDAIHALEDEMLAEARGLGQKILAKEAELEARFRAGDLDEVELERILSELAALRAQLRQVHLRTHLRMRPLLDEQQIASYMSLRGYDTAPADDDAETGDAEIGDAPEAEVDDHEDGDHAHDDAGG